MNFFLFDMQHLGFDIAFRPLVIGSIDFSGNSLFVSCDVISKFCLSNPGNSSRTVIEINVLGIRSQYHKKNKTYEEQNETRSVEQLCASSLLQNID